MKRILAIVFLLGVAWGMVSSCQGRRGNEQAKVYFEDGKSAYDRQDYVLAIRQFCKAESLCNDNNPTLLGEISLGMAFVFHDSYQFDWEEEYLNRALKCFKTAQDTTRIHFALFRIGNQYFSQHKYEESRYILENLLSSSHSSTPLKVDCMRLLSRIYVTEGGPNAKRAIELIDEIALRYHYALNNTDVALRAYANHLLGDDTHLHVFSHLKDNTPEQQYEIDEYAFSAWKKTRPELAYPYLIHRMQYADSVIVGSLRGLAAKNIAEYYEESADLARRDMVRERLFWSILVLSLLLTLISGWLIYNLQIRKRDAENNQLALTIADMDRLLSRSASEAAYNTKKAFAPFEALCKRYYQFEETDQLSKAIYKEMYLLVQDFRNGGESLQNLERLLNWQYQDAISQLRKEQNTLGEEEFRLLDYLAAGFSYPTICTFLGKTSDVVYNKVSRLKKKLSDILLPSNPLHEVLFGDRQKK